MAKKGDWVTVHSIMLTAAERAPQLPVETKEVPMEMWVKGFLTKDSELNEEAEVRTVTNRLETGKLVEVFPTYTHSFGDYVPEIAKIDKILQQELFGGE